ncbi:MAG TPA: hypothetical protein VH331_16115 [Allosphingosinicella sp.]|nr:hypothetical protein [Allosphingosinicella sp.]
MGKLLRSCMIPALLLAAGTARAECSVSSDPGAAVRPLKASEADAHIVVAMSMLPKIMHVDYDGAAKKSGCDLGPLAAGNSGYELWGDDAHGRQRKAIPAKKGAPVALILPVVDIVKAFMAPHPPGKPAQAQVEGYLLATVTKSDVTGWVYYTGMPDAATLKHDMAEVLAGNGHPIFRAGADGKTDLFVPKD